MSANHYFEIEREAPPGEYDCVILTVPNVEEFTAKNGNKVEYLRIEFQIVAGEFEGEVLRSSYPFRNKISPRSKLGKLTKQLLPSVEGGQPVELTELLNIPCRVTLVENEGSGFLDVSKVKRLEDGKPY